MKRMPGALISPRTSWRSPYGTGAPVERINSKGAHVGPFKALSAAGCSHVPGESVPIDRFIDSEVSNLCPLGFQWTMETENASCYGEDGIRNSKNLSATRNCHRLGRLRNTDEISIRGDNRALGETKLRVAPPNASTTQSPCSSRGVGLPKGEWILGWVVELNVLIPIDIRMIHDFGNQQGNGA